MYVHMYVCVCACDRVTVHHYTCIVGIVWQINWFQLFFESVDDFSLKLHSEAVVPFGEAGKCVE